MRRWVVVAVVAIGCKGKPAGTGDPVVERVKQALAAAAPGATVEVKADDMITVGRGSGSVLISLENVRRSCASSETECEATIHSIAENMRKSAVAMAAPDQAAPPLDRTLIRLTPKPTEWLDAADEGAKQIPEKAADNRLVRQKFGADLWWTYVVDEPHGMRMLSQQNLRELGMTVEELHALAVQNLAAQYPKLDLVELAPGMWTIEPGDYLDSARLALTDQWRAEATRRGGTLVMSLPARSRVFVSNDPELRGPFDKITAKAFAEEDHPLSTAVFEWTDKGWIVAK